MGQSLVSIRELKSRLSHYLRPPAILPVCFAN